jgi:ATP-dependent Clp protease ATP-binding subunit ClpA
MFQRLKQRIGDMGVIQTLCLQAENHARRDGQSEPGAEHFLLAALDLPDGTARRAFERVGADHAGLEAAIAAQYAKALGVLGLDVGAEPEAEALEPPHGVYRAAPSGRDVMQALAAHRRFGDASSLVGAHVVAEVASMPHGVAARALREMGIDREALRQAAVDESGAAAGGSPT